MSSARRMFVALMLGERLGARAASAVRKALDMGGEGTRGLRLYGADELHLTLFFLGRVDAAAERDLDLGLSAVASAAPAPVLRVSGSGAFPRRGRERILWLGLGNPVDDDLAALHAAVERACVASGFEADDRPFHPHLTAARVRRGAGGRPPSIPETFYDVALDLEWRPRGLALVESVAGASPTYRPRREYPLASLGLG